MKQIGIHIEIDEKHPAYQWAKRQSDSVNAFGHIGTHLDCYSTTPNETEYELEAIALNCLKGMPQLTDIHDLQLTQKALILYTGNLEQNEYGSKAYGETDTFLSEEVLNAILHLEPQFIIIDSYGIGNHGEEHIKFDRICEKTNCFVIENVYLNDAIANTLTKIRIQLSSAPSSTGKPCKIYAICKN
ncbi:MAG: hypothetical protein ACEPOZ_11170 [Marinifilaceae bacterium]